MIQHHLAIAWRQLRRRAFFSWINVSGLAIGLAACWLIGLYVWHEKSYDTWLPEADRICAVALDLKMGDQEGFTTNTPPPVGPRLLADYPEVEMSARSFPLGAVVTRCERPGQAPLLFNESRAMAVDTAFLELFDFPMAAGDTRSALDRPGSVVLTEAMAEKYFGNTPAMGQSILLNDRTFTVSGIVRDLPEASTVQFDFLAPIADFRVVERFSWSWIWLQVDTWVRLRQQPTDASIAALESKFPAMVRTYAPAAFERIGQNFEANLSHGDRYALRLLPLPKLHLGYEGLVSRHNNLGDRQQVAIFSIAGLLVLLLACVNFMNLSTARSLQRAREVGVRKALGSQRSTLVAQFMAEAFVYSAMAMLLAALLVLAALPWFNRMAGLDWTPADLFSAKTLGLVIALPLGAAMLGGLYPAFYLSKFRSAEIFKTAVSTSGSGGHARVRSSLVVFQFAVSIVLMLCALVVFHQMDAGMKTSPGLARENVLVIENTRYLDDPLKRETFRQQLRQLPEVVSVTHSIFLPSLGSFGDFYEPEQGDQTQPVVQSLPLGSYLTDAGFVPTLGIDILAGRNFMSGDGMLDSTSVILNETAVKAIGWENPLGKWMRYPGNGNQRFQVVGVMRDFHVESLRAPIEPMVLFHETSKAYRAWGMYMAVRLRPGAETAAIEKAAALWKTAVPTAPFEYDFLDATFARMYRAEVKTSAVLGVFTVLALFIGCMGLFALAAFTAERRTREIGIRKVLGASVAQLSALMAADFIKLVLIAVVFALPVAYYFIQKWLNNFAYPVALQWWMFAATGLAALLLAVLTVSYQSIRTALHNPVDSLRS